MGPDRPCHARLGQPWLRACPHTGDDEEAVVMFRDAIQNILPRVIYTVFLQCNRCNPKPQSTKWKWSAVEDLVRVNKIKRLDGV